MNRQIEISCSAALILVFMVSCTTLGIEFGESQTFESPQAAGHAVSTALQNNDQDALRKIFGRGSEELLSSGDTVLDKNERDRFLNAYTLQHGWSEWGDDTAILEVGENAWPFPIPLVKGKHGWSFDTPAGEGEILNRRIGKNELDAIQACLAFVDAERDYYRWNPQQHAQPEYARLILSSPGEKDGLYWPTPASEAPSPLGPLYAAATSEGYSPTQGGGKPFLGYFYRILDSQGTHAPGGAFQYVENGTMNRGFALIARPAKYGSSGIMTFLVNQLGLVYEKDLGSDTQEIAAGIQAFDPDPSWTLVPPTALASLND